MDDLTRLKLEAQLRRDEGVVRTAYPDSLGVPTIGVGHNLSTPISDEAIDQILNDDIAATESQLLSVLPWASQLSPARYGALLNMAFNLGVAGLLEFRRMLAALERQDWTTAARELLDSTYARQVGTRADRLARQLETDQWV